MIFLNEAIEDVKRHYTMIPDDKFMEIIALDPTFNPDVDKVGTYGKWLLNKYKAGTLTDDQFEDAQTALTIFDRYKRVLPNKDIGQYRTVEELMQAIADLDDEKFYDMMTPSQRNKYGRKIKAGKIITRAEDDYEIMYDSPQFIVYIPHTYQASVKLGKGAVWCTAHETNDYHYKQYTSDGGKLYIFKDKQTGEKYQYSDKANELHDSQNRNFDWYSVFSKDEKLYKILCHKFPKRFKYVTTEPKTVFDNDNFIVIEKNRWDSYRNDISSGYTIEDKATGKKYLWNKGDTRGLNDENGKQVAVAQILLKDKELNRFLTSLNDEVFPDYTPLEADGTFVYTGGQIKSGTIREAVRRVVIGEGVTEIQRRAFMGCDHLIEAVISDGVISIGGSAFRECYRLANITIPESVVTIGATAFFDCTKLQSITIPESVTTLGSYAFSGCESLKEANIAGSVKVIPECAFADCTALETVTIGAGIGVIGTEAFKSCRSLKTLKIPSSVTTIQEEAFADCRSLEKARISPMIKTIGKDAFDSCNNLTIYSKSDYVKDYCSTAKINYSEISLESNESLKLRIGEDTSCIPSKTSYMNATKDKNGIYYFGKKPNAPKSWRDECGVKKQRKLSIKESEESTELDEAAITASIGNIMNQVMGLVHDAFEFFGGSFAPEFLMKSKDEPDVEVKVKGNGKNVEIIPQYDHIPDYLNIKKGISISNAPKTIADTAIDAVEHYKELKK